MLPWVISSQLFSAPEAEETAHRSEMDWKAPDGKSPNRRDILAVSRRQPDVQTTEMDRPGAISRKPSHCGLQRNHHIPPCSGDLTAGAKVPVVLWLQIPSEAFQQTRSLKMHCCPLAFTGKPPSALLLPCNQLVSIEPSSITSTTLQGQPDLACLNKWGNYYSSKQLLSPGEPTCSSTPTAKADQNQAEVFIQA